MKTTIEINTERFFDILSKGKVKGDTVNIRTAYSTMEILSKILDAHDIEYEWDDNRFSISFCWKDCGEIAPNFYDHYAELEILDKTNNVRHLIEDYFNKELGPIMDFDLSNFLAQEVIKEMDNNKIYFDHQNIKPLYRDDIITLAKGFLLEKLMLYSKSISKKYVPSDDYKKYEGEIREIYEQYFHLTFDYKGNLIDLFTSHTLEHIEKEGLLPEFEESIDDFVTDVLSVIYDDIPYLESVTEQ